MEGALGVHGGCVEGALRMRLGVRGGRVEGVLRIH